MQSNILDDCVIEPMDKDVGEINAARDMSQTNVAIMAARKDLRHMSKVKNFGSDSRTVNKASIALAVTPCLVCCRGNHNLCTYASGIAAAREDLTIKAIAREYRFIHT